MSFKTSPILNRLKNIKGWKQSSFPIKTSNYSRDISLNLKIYLLVKAYLVLNNFKLILWQLRTYENAHKILYIMLIHSKISQKVDDSTSKNHLTKFTYPMYLQSNKNSLYFLYHNASNFKQFVRYQFNTLQKKLPSLLWYNNICLSKWTITLDIAWKIQKQEKDLDFKKKVKYFYNQLNYISVKRPLKNNKFFLPLLLKQKLYFQLRILEKEIYFFQKYTKIFNEQRLNINAKNFAFSVYIKSILRLKNLMWKKYLYLKKLTQMIFLLKCSYFYLGVKGQFETKKQTYQYQLVNFYLRKKKNKNLMFLQKNLIKHYKNNQLFLKSMVNFIDLKQIFIYNKIFNKTHPNSSSFFFNYKLFFFIIKNYFYLFRHSNLKKFKSSAKIVVKGQIYWRYFWLAQYYFYYLDKEIYKHNGILNFIPTFGFNKFKYSSSKLLYQDYYIPGQKIINTPVSSWKNYKFSRKLWQIKTKITFFKTRFFYLLPTFFLFSKIIRWNEQKLRMYAQNKTYSHSLRLKLKRKKMNKIILRPTKIKFFNYKKGRFYNKNKKKLNIEKKKKDKCKNIFNKNVIKYKFSFRKNNHAISLFVVKQQLRYILQKFLKQYIQLSFKLKILNSMDEFNTLKFYRIYFKALNKNQKQNQSQNIKLKNETATFPIRSYFYLSPKNKVFSQKYFNKLLKKKDKIKSLKKQKDSKFNFLLLKTIKFKKLKIIRNFKSNSLLLKFQSSIGIEDQISSKDKLIFQDKKWKEFVKRTFPILLIFRKHFDTQILVNHIAKELEHTQKHTYILFMLRQILLIIPLERLIAYRIIIFGRINGAKKARTISLTKGKIPLQTLTKNINFGSEYSHARVGAFGVKLWIYF